MISSETGFRARQERNPQFLINRASIALPV
jgi:hypothetical protein